MKIKIALASLIVVALILILASRGFTFQNEPDGFRDLKWGDPSTESMEYLSTFKGNRAYTIPDDKMSMGNVEFDWIVYTFYCGVEDAGLTTFKGQSERFVSVGLYFKKEENFDLLKTICRGRFGEETEGSFNELSWQGQKAFVLLKYDMAEKKGYLSIASAQIAAEAEEAQKQKEIEEAEKDW